MRIVQSRKSQPSSRASPPQPGVCSEILQERSDRPAARDIQDKLSQHPEGSVREKSVLCWVWKQANRRDGLPSKHWHTLSTSVNTECDLCTGGWCQHISHIYHQQDRQCPAPGQSERGHLLQAAVRHVGSPFPSSSGQTGLLILEATPTLDQSKPSVIIKRNNNTDSLIFQCRMYFYVDTTLW